LALPNLATKNFYDLRGNPVAKFSPGRRGSEWRRTMERGRVTTQYVTDGGAVNNANVQRTDWTNATSVTNDVVLSQD